MGGADRLDVRQGGETALRGQMPFMRWTAVEPSETV